MIRGMPLPQVLVTGGTGFVGGRLVRELVAQGHRVKVLARPGSSLRALAGLEPSRLEVVHGDVTIGHTVYRALAGCDRLFHVAAEFKIWDRRPQKIFDAAIVGTRETLEAARRRGIEKIVVTSSTAAVGASREPTSMDETFAFNRENSAPYIVGKRRAEEIALAMAKNGMPIVVVNPATVMGPGDYKPTPSGELILTYLNWKLPVGVPWSRGGFSIVDVDDVAKGHVLAMQKGRVGERYILGGTNATVEQFFTTLSEITGLAGPGLRTPPALAALAGALAELGARISGRRPRLTYRFARDYVGWFVWVSSEKAQKELGYAARPLRPTLMRAVRFFLENGYVPKGRLEKIRFDLRAAA
jgi:dihydroflavonol-4-reductase